MMCILKKLKITMGVILMMSLLAGLFGCDRTSKEPLDTSDLGELPPAFIKETPETPGKLVGITYEYSAGSMVWGTEFNIDLTSDEILSCAYWDMGRNRSEMTTKENVPITNEQWEDIEKAVLDLWGVWEEIPEKVMNSKPDPDIQILDGGGYNRWWLTWETAEGTKKILYYYSNDRRITTLIDLLQNIADGGNRKITWYDPPVLTSATYINDKTKCSFQCTLWDGYDNGYRFIVRFDEGDQKVDIYDHTDDSIWEAAKPAFEWIDFDQYKDGSYSKPITLNVTYSDNSYKCIVPDKEAVNIIEPYLRKLTLKYLEEKQE